MRKLLILTLLCVLCALGTSWAQTYNPNVHTGINRPLGAYGIPVDGRSYYYDAPNYTWRPFSSTTEVLSYLPKVARGGNPMIFIRNGDSTTIWTFLNGTDDSDLVKIYPSPGVTDLSDVMKYVDTASLSHRIDTRLPISDTTAMLAPYLRGEKDSAALNHTITVNGVTKKLQENPNFVVSGGGGGSGTDTTTQVTSPLTIQRSGDTLTIGADTTTALATKRDLGGKVDTAAGKGLSTNDYNDAAVSKLSSIQSGAEVNVQPDLAQSGSTADDFVKNKNNNYLVNGKGYITSTQAADQISDSLANHPGGGTDTTHGVQAPLTITRSGNKVTYGADTTTAVTGLATKGDIPKNNNALTNGAGYLTHSTVAPQIGDSMDSRLDGSVIVDTTLSALPRKDIGSTWGLKVTGGDSSTVGNQNVNIIPDTTTGHLATQHYADSVSQTSTGATNLGIGTRTATTVSITSSTGSSATFPAATTSQAGAMTATDKVKLNGIATGAEQNVQSDWNQTNTTADDYIKNKPTLGTDSSVTGEYPIQVDIDGVHRVVKVADDAYVVIEPDSSNTVALPNTNLGNSDLSLTDLARWVNVNGGAIYVIDSLGITNPNSNYILKISQDGLDIHYGSLKALTQLGSTGDSIAVKHNGELRALPASTYSTPAQVVDSIESNVPSLDAVLNVGHTSSNGINVGDVQTFGSFTNTNPINATLQASSGGSYFPLAVIGGGAGNDGAPESRYLYIDKIGFHWRGTDGTDLMALDSTGILSFLKYKNNSGEDSILTVDEDGNVKLKYFSGANLATQNLTQSSSIDRKYNLNGGSLTFKQDNDSIIIAPNGNLVSSKLIQANGIVNVTGNDFISYGEANLLGGVVLKLVQGITEDYTVTSTDVVLVTSQTSGITITMPSSSVLGRVLTIRNAGTGDLTLTNIHSGDATTITAGSTGKYIYVSGSEWYAIN